MFEHVFFDSHLSLVIWWIKFQVIISKGLESNESFDVINHLWGREYGVEVMITINS
jgi:hypothetical protein